VAIDALPNAQEASSLAKAMTAAAPAGTLPGAILRLARRGIEVVGSFPPDIATESSTLREIFALWQVTSTLSPLLRNGRFRTGLDNMGVVFITGGYIPESAPGFQPLRSTSGGSNLEELQRFAILLDDLQRSEHISLATFWTPRDLNVRADALSHACESRPGDYALARDTFLALDKAWGPHTIDRFASADSLQPLRAPHTGRFCSWFYDPAAVCTDAFTVSWEADVNWVFPPARLALRAAQHLVASGAPGTLVVAKRRDLTVWPFLFPNGARQRHAPFVSEIRPLGRGHQILTRLDDAASWIADTEWLAVRVRGDRAHPRSSK
jgi:hypothetical protein